MKIVKAFSVLAAPIAFSALAFTSQAALAGSGYGKCDQAQNDVAFSQCVTAEIAEEFARQERATTADQQVGISANLIAETAGNVLETVAKRYVTPVSFNSVTARDCTTYDADLVVGGDSVNVDKESCLNAGVIVGESNNGLNLFACYAYHDEPVILTGLSCRNTGGGVPVFSSGHNAAAIGGLAAVRNGSVCIEASGLHPGAQNQLGQRVGANGSTQLNFCAASPR